MRIDPVDVFASTAVSLAGWMLGFPGFQVRSGCIGKVMLPQDREALRDL
jgi:hypothetical protein